MEGSLDLEYVVTTTFLQILVESRSVLSSCLHGKSTFAREDIVGQSPLGQ